MIAMISARSPATGRPQKFACTTPGCQVAHSVRWPHRNRQNGASHSHFCAQTLVSAQGCPSALLVLRRLAGLHFLGIFVVELDVTLVAALQHVDWVVDVVRGESLLAQIDLLDLLRGCLLK